MRGKTIIFDLDGTLVDTVPDLLSAANHALTLNGFDQTSLTIIRSAASFGARRMIEESLRFQNARVDNDGLTKLVDQLLEYYGQNIAVSSQAFASVYETLDLLKSEQARLVVCTNKLEHLARDLLRTLKLDEYFLAVVGRNSCQFSKPDARVIQFSLALVGGDPENSVMVGDSEVDVLAAKNAAIPVIAITHGYSDQPLETFKPNAIINHFDELYLAIRSLETFKL